MILQLLFDEASHQIPDEHSVYLQPSGQIGRHAAEHRDIHIIIMLGVCHSVVPNSMSFDEVIVACWTCAQTTEANHAWSPEEFSAKTLYP